MEAGRLIKINIAVAVIFILSIGSIGGYALGYARASQNRFPEIKTVGEINANGIRKEDTHNYGIPEDAMYIASVKGKYYYSVLDSRAFRISDKNRLFFASAEEAREKGYIKR